MNPAHIRTLMFFGEEKFNKLRSSFVAIFGLGGVGSYAAEALARVGVGKLKIIDCDIIKKSNLNRQLFALTPDVGKPKSEVAKDRLKSIHPEIEIESHQAFFSKDTKNFLVTPDLDFVIDAVDSLNPKVELIKHCIEKKISYYFFNGSSSQKRSFLS